MTELNTKYGFCKGTCRRWVPRDEMLSINVSVYNRENDEYKIPLRYCPNCWEKMVDYFSTMRWDNNLKTAAEIKSNEALANDSDLSYDDSLRIVEAAAVARQRKFRIDKSNNKDYCDYHQCESEAEFRKAGKQVDVEY